MTNSNELINWLGEFNSEHNNLGFDSRLAEKTADELINETQ